MAKKPVLRKAQELCGEADPAVAAALTGIIYQAKLFNRQARVAVPEEEVATEVISLWRMVMHALKTGAVPGV
jgi:Tfp pilus assembly PilM family ATPase